MIVVRADDNPLVRLAGDARDHITIRLVDVLHRRGDFHLHLRQHEAALSVRVFAVERLLQVLQIFPARREQCRRRIGADGCRDDSAPRAAAVAHEREKLASIWRVRARHDEHRLCAALARHHRLVAQARIAVEIRATRRLHILGHITEDKHDLVLHIQPLVAVVTLLPRALGHAQAVTREHHRALRRALIAERKRAEFLVEHERRRVASVRDMKRILSRHQPLARVEFELLEVRLAPRQRLQSSLCKIFTEPFRGELRSIAAHRTARMCVIREQSYFELQIVGRNLRSQ